MAHPLDFRFSRLVPKLWVPRPCVLCKGGYDDADSIEPFTVGSPAPALRNLREGQGTHIVVGPGSKGWATRQDACYKEHDWCYSRARVGGTSPSSCDFQLQQCLRPVNSSGAENTHSWIAEPLFSVCEMFPYLCVHN